MSEAFFSNTPKEWAKFFADLRKNAYIATVITVMNITKDYEVL